MEDVRRIKQLNSDLKSIDLELATIKSQLVDKQKKYEVKLGERKLKQQELDSLNNTTTIKVSEHAMLRYLERVEGININALEKKILDSPTLALINHFKGNGTFNVDNYSLVLKNYTVVTVNN